MRKLVEFPSEIFAVISGYLSLLELEALLSTGALLLIHKLKHGGVEILQAPRWIATGMCDKIYPRTKCDKWTCSGCFRGLLPAFPMGTMNAFLEKVLSNYLVIGSSMPNLESFTLYLTGVGFRPSVFSNLPFQFFIGTLPRSLKHLTMKSGPGLHSDRLDSIMVAWPPALETLNVSLEVPNAWPVNQYVRYSNLWIELESLQQLPNIGKSIHLKSIEAVKTPIFDLEKFLPALLRHALLLYRQPDYHNTIIESTSDIQGARHWSLPHTLETLDLDGSIKFPSNWLPASLTKLTARSAALDWQEGSLPRLRIWNGRFFPRCALPSCQSMDLSFPTNIVFYGYPHQGAPKLLDLLEASDSFSQKTASSPLPPSLMAYIPFNYATTLTTLILPVMSWELQNSDEHRAIFSIPTLTTLLGARLAPPQRIVLKPGGELALDPLDGYTPSLAHFPPNLTSFTLIRAEVVREWFLHLLPNSMRDIQLYGVARVDKNALQKAQLDRFDFLETFIIGGFTRSMDAPNQGDVAVTAEWMQSVLSALPSKSLHCLNLGWRLEDLTDGDMEYEADLELSSSMTSSKDVQKRLFPHSTLSPSLSFPFPHLTNLSLVNTRMILPQFLKLPSSLTRVSVESVLVRSKFHLSLLPSLPSCLPLLDINDIPIRISFDIFGIGTDAERAAQEIIDGYSMDTESTKDVPHSSMILQALPLHLLRGNDYKKAVSLLLNAISIRPEFLHLQTILEHLKPVMFTFHQDPSVPFGFGII